MGPLSAALGSERSRRLKLEVFGIRDLIKGPGLLLEIDWPVVAPTSPRVLAVYQFEGVVRFHLSHNMVRRDVYTGSIWASSRRISTRQKATINQDLGAGQHDHSPSSHSDTVSKILHTGDLQQSSGYCDLKYCAWIDRAQKICWHRDGGFRISR